MDSTPCVSRLEFLTLDCLWSFSVQFFIGWPAILCSQRLAENFSFHLLFNCHLDVLVLASRFNVFADDHGVLPPPPSSLLLPSFLSPPLRINSADVRPSLKMSDRLVHPHIVLVDTLPPSFLSSSFPRPLVSSLPALMVFVRFRFFCRGAARPSSLLVVRFCLSRPCRSFLFLLLVLPPSPLLESSLPLVLRNCRETRPDLLCRSPAPFPITPLGRLPGPC